ncbi:MAG: hypothetical protein ABW141_01385 [Candidatus Thiodiazotropha endolucinida]
MKKRPTHGRVGLKRFISAPEEDRNHKYQLPSIAARKGKLEEFLSTT